MTPFVRVDDDIASILRELSAKERRPIRQVIRDAIQQYQKEKFWFEVETSVERLRANPEASTEYQDEIRTLGG